VARLLDAVSDTQQGTGKVANPTPTVRGRYTGTGRYCVLHSESCWRYYYERLLDSVNQR